MSYYYFRQSYNNVTKIAEYPNEIDTGIFTNLTQLTTEQETFYLANPNASVSEVQQCQLITYTQNELTLAQVKSIALKYLKDTFDSNVKNVTQYTEFERYMALLSQALLKASLLDSDKCYYTQAEAVEILKDANTSTKQFRTDYETNVAAVNSAETIDAIKTLLPNLTY